MREKDKKAEGMKREREANRQTDGQRERDRSRERCQMGIILDPVGPDSKHFILVSIYKWA